MKPFFAALQFLTIIPVSGKLAGGADELKRSVPYFPLVGLLIGLAAAGVDRVVFMHLPPLPATVLIVMFLVGVSGGLHLDGLADTADGFLSARPREKTLEIMRDSRTGVMGTIAVVFIILFRVAVLEPIAFDQRWKVVLLMPFAGRIAVVLMMAFLPYVRTAGGIATLFQEKRSPLHALWAVFFFFPAWWWVGGWVGFALGLLPFVAAALFAAYCLRKVGGFTGDTLGAVCELTEVVPPLVVVVM